MHFSLCGLRHQLTWASLFLVASACGSPNDPLPEEVIRVWRNPAPGFAENYFEIREDSILIGIDAYQFKMHSIASVESTASRGLTEFRIEYMADDGEAVPLLLVFTPGNPPRLQIGARPDQWVPEEHAHWLKNEAS
ncbi:MAG: hypothetical protein JRG89_22155 [Deltaproteobacteria bacterium]|nr:hypothetical protein [Deltaproteobacteria bacterium]